MRRITISPEEGDVKVMLTVNLFRAKSYSQSPLDGRKRNIPLNLEIFYVQWALFWQYIVNMKILPVSLTGGGTQSKIKDLFTLPSVGDSHLLVLRHSLFRHTPPTIRRRQNECYIRILALFVKEPTNIRADLRSLSTGCAQSLSLYGYAAPN